MPWAGTCSYSQTTPPLFLFFLFLFFIGDTGQTGVADAPICSAKQNDLLPWAPPSLSSPSISSDRRPERPLWTFKEAQRVKEPELRIKAGDGFLEGLRRRDALWAPVRLLGATCCFSSRWTSAARQHQMGLGGNGELCVCVLSVWKWSFFGVQVFIHAKLNVSASGASSLLR